MYKQNTDKTLSERDDGSLEEYEITELKRGMKMAEAYLQIESAWYDKNAGACYISFCIDRAHITECSEANATPPITYTTGRKREHAEDSDQEDLSPSEQATNTSPKKMKLEKENEAATVSQDQKSQGATDSSVSA